MEENETRAFLEATLKKEKLGAKSRKEDKRCFCIKKEYFEEVDEPEAKDMEGPDIPY
jgi:hypothetical protein